MPRLSNPTSSAPSRHARPVLRRHAKKNPVPRGTRSKERSPPRARATYVRASYAPTVVFSNYSVSPPLPPRARRSNISSYDWGTSSAMVDSRAVIPNPHGCVTGAFLLATAKRWPISTQPSILAECVRIFNSARTAERRWSPTPIHYVARWNRDCSAERHRNSFNIWL